MGDQSGGLLKAKGISGREWSLRMVKTLTPAKKGGSVSTVAVVEDTNTGLKLCAKRQFGESEERIRKLVKEAALWKHVGVNAVAANDSMPGCVEIIRSEQDEKWPATIVRLHDCIVFNSEPQSVVYLMEYLPEPEFPKSISEAQIFSIVRDVCNGLLLLCDAGVKAHGDLVMDHIQFGTDLRAKIGGFGDSRSRANDNSPKDDIYSLGLLVYELQFSRKPPAGLKTKKSSDFANSIPPESKSCSPKVLSLLKLLLHEHRKQSLTMDAVRFEVAVGQGLVPETTPVRPSRQRKPEKREKRLTKELTSDSPVRRNSQVNTSEADDPSTGKLARVTRSEAVAIPADNSSRPVRSASMAPSRGRSTVQTIAEPGVSELAPGAAPESGSTLKPARKKTPVASHEMKSTLAPSNGITVLRSLSEKLMTKRKEASVDFLVNKVVDNSALPINDKYVRYHIVEAQLRKDYSEELYKSLRKKPVQKSSFIGFKTVALLHRLSLEGPVEFLEQSLKQEQFLLWIEEYAASEQEDKTLAFFNGEITAFAQLVSLKAKFYTDYSDAFLPNWSRTLFDAGSDPIAGRRMPAIMRIHEILDKANSLVQALLLSDNCKDLSYSAVPGLVLEVTAAYTCTCLLVETAQQQEQVELSDVFRACHEATRETMEGVLSNPDAAKLCRGEILLKLSDEPALAVNGAHGLGSSGLVNATSNDLQRVRRSKSMMAKLPVDNEVESRREVQQKDRDIPSAPQPKRSENDETRRVSSGFEAGVKVNVRHLPSRRASTSTPQPPKVAEMLASTPLDSPANPVEVAPPRQAYREASYRPELDRSPRNAYREPPPYPPERFAERPRNYRRDHHDDDYYRRERVPLSRHYDDQPPARGRAPRYSLQEERRRDYSGSDSADYSSGGPDRHSNDSRGSATKNRRTSDDRRKKKEKSKKKESSRRRDSASPSSDGSSSVERTRRKSKTSKTKKSKKAKRKSKREVHSESEISHVADQPIQDLGQLRLTPKHIVNPMEIQYGKLIGQGGFGAVYKGLFRGEIVAIKKAHANTLKSRKAIEEFQREVAVLCALNHPNILRFMGACTQPPNLIIVTEFCARGTLFDYLHKENQKPPWALYKKMALDLCQGMMYLHSSNLLHRDLKSSNLMLSNNFDIKVGDFGLTRVQQSFGPMTGQCGTFQYMAPEVLGSRPYSEKADVFSFGIILWEMAAKQLPYFGMQPMQTSAAARMAACDQAANAKVLAYRTEATTELRSMPRVPLDLGLLKKARAGESAKDHCGAQPYYLPLAVQPREDLVMHVGERIILRVARANRQSRNVKTTLNVASGCAQHFPAPSRLGGGYTSFKFSTAALQRGGYDRQSSTTMLQPERCTNVLVTTSALYSGPPLSQQLGQSSRRTNHVL
ncbi:hypothetical protein NDN08_001445 [Rhodosorus marinus]|uniref:Protein kinase domain-containing protein n=1 Tax=Rhodosorus marinus TaxID=101924 RepID=A0AAV8UV00_9RHOD|nr:hypothetical protein NDN08_001445 [Rhodosorus marinus]